MSKLIIRFDDDMSELEALDYARVVVEAGRDGGKMYCYHTTFKDNISVSCFKPSGTTDTFVIYKDSN